MKSKWINIENEINKVFSSVTNKLPNPTLFIVTGLPYVGKSTVRKAMYLAGNAVNLDAGDIYHSITCGRLDSFPPIIFLKELNYIGSHIVQIAVEKKHSLIVELSSTFISQNHSDFETNIINKYKSIGYKTFTPFLDADEETLRERANQIKYPYTASIYTDQYHYEWLNGIDK